MTRIRPSLPRLPRPGVPAAARLVPALALLLLGGCSNLAGVGGGSSYACKAPDGVRCESVSGTYHNALHGNLPSQRRGSAAPQEPAPPLRTALPDASAAASGSTAAHAGGSVSSATAATRTLPPGAYTGIPLRSPTRILRLWVKAWEDADGDLVDQGYLYVPVDTGRWLIEHRQRPVREAYAPVRAPRAAARPGAEGSDADTASVDAPSRAPTSLSDRIQAARGAPAFEFDAPGAHDAK